MRGKSSEWREFENTSIVLPALAQQLPTQPLCSDTPTLWIDGNNLDCLRLTLRHEPETEGYLRWEDLLIERDRRLGLDRQPGTGAPKQTSIFWGDEHVANAAHGADRLRMFGINLDLAAKPGDPEVNRAVEGLHVAMRGDLEEPIPHQWAVRVLGEHFQQVKLAGRQGLFAAAIAIDQNPLFEIEQPPAHAHAPAGRSGDGGASGTSQHGLDPGQKFARLKGFGDVVVGTGFEPDDAIDRVGRGSNHNNADPATLLAQPARQCKSVLPLQADIEHNQGRQGALDQAPQRCAAIDAVDPEILPRQKIDEQLPLSRLVFDHYDMGSLVHCLPTRIATPSAVSQPCREPRIVSSRISKKAGECTWRARFTFDERQSLLDRRC